MKTVKILMVISLCVVCNAMIATAQIQTSEDFRRDGLTQDFRHQQDDRNKSFEVNRTLDEYNHRREADHSRNADKSNWQIDLEDRIRTEEMKRDINRELERGSRW